MRSRIGDTDELTANAIAFGAAETGGRLGHLIEAMVRATDIGEHRPPLLRTNGFGVSTHGARELNPDGLLAGAIGARLHQPCRRFGLDFGQLCFAESRGNTVTRRHLQRNIQA